MRFFLDTANLDEIREAASLGVLAGVTTNPTLLARDGGDPMENLRAICEVVDGPVNAEVVGTDAETIVREGKKLRLLGDNICVKIPMNKEGLKAVHALDAEGIDTTVTLIFNPQQALLAARAGATYVCPFVGRLDDVGYDGLDVIRDIVEIFETHDIATEVLVASVRNPIHVLEAAIAGAGIATVPLKVLDQMIRHPLTDRGIEQFLQDWRKLGVDIA
ncbi:MAG: fructose-6-phosphate aldolase [Candidatus Eisenbacteria bacterium]|nr:fructose-6-phosphate aldolase [Candidatus Eisenbacteria bacterium]